MRLTRLVLVLMFAFVSAAFAQDKPSQAAPASATGQGPKGQMPRHQHMMEMHKQEMDAMKADIDKMKASLAQMKANMLTIKDTNEMARWRNNADIWDTVIAHMERMQKNMESMGPGMMHGPGMGGPPPTPKPPQ
jgi:hypothetical protein